MKESKEKGESNTTKINAAKEERGSEAIENADEGRGRAKDALEKSKSGLSSTEDRGRRGDREEEDLEGHRKRSRSSRSPDRKNEDGDGGDTERPKKKTKRRGVDPAKYARRNTSETIAAARARYFERCGGAEMREEMQDMVC